MNPFTPKKHFHTLQGSLYICLTINKLACRLSQNPVLRTVKIKSLIQNEIN